MNEVNKPKKPLIYYYAIVILSLALLNLFAIPAMNQREIKEVDYGTFMKATENQERIVFFTLSKEMKKNRFIRPDL